jgi:hypothetical protein
VLFRSDKIYWEISKKFSEYYTGIINNYDFNIKLQEINMNENNLIYYDKKFPKDNDKTIKITPLGLNWIIGGSDSFMTWYEPSKNPIKVGFTNINTPFVDWPISSLKELDRCNIKNKLTLVRTDFPHNVEMGDDPRWCVSFRLANPEKYPWDSIVSMLRDKKLLVER